MLNSLHSCNFRFFYFAENYLFFIQGEVQAFHWNNVQATSHPVITYYREQGDFKESPNILLDYT